jgi:hypothetical protein
MSLQNEMKEYVKATFGVYSSEKIDTFAKEKNPVVDPKGFLELCVDFISTMLGEETAREKMKPFYEKYIFNFEVKNG